MGARQEKNGFDKVVDPDNMAVVALEAELVAGTVG